MTETMIWMPKQGDRVRLRGGTYGQGFVQPLRKWAETGKPGTVERVFVPLGRAPQRPVVVVMFDMRKGSLHARQYLSPYDLEPIGDK